MQKTLLVTGGCGFIGSAFVRHLLSKTEYRVVNVDKLTYAGNLESLASALPSERHVFEQVDVSDAAGMSRIFAVHRPAAVLHLAAESHVDRSIDGAAAFIQSNIVGTYTLLDAARSYWLTLDEEARDSFRFLHVSTDEVYGSLEADGAFTECTPYAPRSPYAASKAASDHLVRAWHHTYGMPVLVTNCSNNYGPFQFPEKLIPLTTLRAVAGRPIPVYGDGGNVRDWLYVDDHVRALFATLQRGRAGETYNIGGNNERTNLDVVRQICALLDELAPKNVPHESLITFVKDRPGHDRRYAIDATKAQSELGWAAAETFESGLRRTVMWYLQNAEWCERVTTGKYRLGRLGLSEAAA